jgi:cold shock CspA family protein
MDTQQPQNQTQTDVQHHDPAMIIMDEIVDRPTEVGAFTGQVKWWNDRLGFGFATVCTCEERGRDVFVHHTGIRPLSSNYRTLRKGEYVNFNITNGHNGQQAVDVTGICGGMLMCDVQQQRHRSSHQQPFYR